MEMKAAANGSCPRARCENFKWLVLSETTLRASTLTTQKEKISRLRESGTEIWHFYMKYSAASRCSLFDWLIISFVISCDLWERSWNPLIFTPECFRCGAERMGNTSVLMSSPIRQAWFIYLSQKSMKYHGCCSFAGVGSILLLRIVPSLRTSYRFIPELPLCFWCKRSASRLLRRSRAQYTCHCQSVFIRHLWR